jgi:RNA polymerase sigma-70 factor (ECF subfamily)
MAELRPRPAAAIDAVYRAEYPRVLGAVARSTGDLELAEDAVQDAFGQALRTWPNDGVPANPAAWLTTVARRRALDVLRRDGRRPELERRASPATLAEVVARDAAAAERDELAMVFLACHPALSAPARTIVTLRFVFGLQVPEIARVLLAGEPGVAKQLQRARAKIRDARFAIAVPPEERLGERLPSALDCLYLVFTEGYASSVHEDLIRVDLCDEAMRLTRQLTRLAPDDASAHALLALMCFQHSRAGARLDEQGELVLLEDQDRGRWDGRLIAEGRVHLQRASRRRSHDRRTLAYVIQAQLAALHAVASSWETTDWPAVLARYDELVALTDSPVVALNRVVAVSFVDGPAAALAQLDTLSHEPRLLEAHPYHAVHADLLARLGRRDEAAGAYDRAAQLARSSAERRFLQRRREAQR